MLLRGCKIISKIQLNLKKIIKFFLFLYKLYLYSIFLNSDQIMNKNTVTNYYKAE